MRAANDIENGEYLNVEVRYDRNIYEVDDEYAVDARHMPRSAAKHAVAAAALHGHDRTQVTGHASGVVAGRRGGVLATNHGQVGTGRGGRTLGGGRGGDGSRPIPPCPVPVRPEEMARLERLRHALAHAELPEDEKEDHDAQKWASTLLGKEYVHHPGDPEGPYMQHGLRVGQPQHAATPTSSRSMVSPRVEAELADYSSPRLDDPIHCPVFPEQQSPPAAHVAYPSKRWFRIDSTNAPPPETDFTFLEDLWRKENNLGFNRTLPKHLAKPKPGEQPAPPPWDSSCVSQVKRFAVQVRSWNRVEPHLMPAHFMTTTTTRPKDKSKPFVNSPRLARTVEKVVVTDADHSTPLGRNATQAVHTGLAGRAAAAASAAAPPVVTMAAAVEQRSMAIPVLSGSMPTPLRPSVRIGGDDRSVVSFAEGTLDGSASTGSRKKRVAAGARGGKRQQQQMRSTMRSSGGGNGNANGNGNNYRGSNNNNNSNNNNQQGEGGASSPRSPRPPPTERGPWKPTNSIARHFSYHLAETAAAMGRPQEQEGQQQPQHGH